MASNYGGYGAISFPLTIPTGVDQVDHLDPGQTQIAGLLKAAINAELGTLWAQLCGALPSVHYLRRPPYPLPVMEIVDTEPSPAQMGQRFARWPILAVYREGEPKTDCYTLYESQTAQQWAVDWVVGPLDAGDQARIGKFAIDVAACIRRTIDEGFHPDYRNATSCFYGIFSRIKAIGQMGPGVAQVLGDEKGAGYYGISVLLESVERNIRTVGHSSDVRNKFYPAYAAAPAGTVTTDIIADENYDHKTPDPE